MEFELRSWILLNALLSRDNNSAILERAHGHVFADAWLRDYTQGQNND